MKVDVGGSTQITMVATCPRESVNWLATFIQGFSIPYESEIVVVGPVRLNKFIDFHTDKELWVNKNPERLWRTAP